MSGELSDQKSSITDSSESLDNSPATTSTAPDGLAGATDPEPTPGKEAAVDSEAPASAEPTSEIAGEAAQPESTTPEPVTEPVAKPAVAAEPVTSQAEDAEPSQHTEGSPHQASKGSTPEKEKTPESAGTEDAATPRTIERIKIGSQRDEQEKIEAKAQTPSATEIPNQEKVDLPNLREADEEVEAALAEALGESPVENLLEAAAKTKEVEIVEGAKLKALVVSVHKEQVLFDLGGGAQGAIAENKFEQRPDLGSSVDVIVRGRDAEDGLYELALPGSSVEVAGWDELQEGLVVDAKVTGSNTGGLECVVGGIRAFMPASQISLYRVEQLSDFIGKQLQAVILEAKRSKRNLVISHRSILEREREEAKKKLLEEIKPGDVREGIVRSLRPFGAFVDIGGVEGMVHVSQLSWDRIKHPNEVLEEGQKIKVKVQKVNQQTGKIGLLFRDLSENPWDRVEQKYPVGSKVKGTVSKIADFGAFVKLEPGVEGMIHISELDHGRVRRVSDILNDGQETEAQVLSVDAKAQRIGLSLKALKEPPPKEEAPAAEEEAPRKQQRKRKTQLKGGISGPSGGEQFGLRW